MYKIIQPYKNIRLKFLFSNNRYKFFYFFFPHFYNSFFFSPSYHSKYSELMHTISYPNKTYIYTYIVINEFEYNNSSAQFREIYIRAFSGSYIGKGARELRDEYIACIYVRARLSIYKGKRARDSLHYTHTYINVYR